MPGLALGGEEGSWAGMAAGREEDVGAALDEGDGEDEPGVIGDDVGDLVVWGGRPARRLCF